MKKNVIMVLLDGTRQDRINLSEELSGITKKGLYFSGMITAAPYTMASIHAIFTGIYPSKNGVDAYMNMFNFKKDKCKTLQQYLKENSFYTIAEIGNDSIVPKEGFDEFLIHDEYKDDLVDKHTKVIKNISRDKPFFIFFQYDKLHTDAVLNVAKKHDDFSEGFFNNKQSNMDRYNSCLKDSGVYAQEILNCIKNEGLSNETIVIFFSDHGMSNGEKQGEKMYGSFLYDYTLKVYSVIISPEFEHKLIENQTRTIDLMPTVLDLLNISHDKNFELIQGKSLLPFVSDVEKEDRVAFCETGGLGGPWPSPKKPNVRAIRYNNWKLIHNVSPNSWELYHLVNDPKEVSNLYDDSLEVVSYLKEKMIAINRENNIDLDIDIKL